MSTTLCSDSYQEYTPSILARDSDLVPWSAPLFALDVPGELVPQIFEVENVPEEILECFLMLWIVVRVGHVQQLVVHQLQFHQGFLRLRVESLLAVVLF